MMKLSSISTIESTPSGLSTEEANHRLKAYGPNLIPEVEIPFFRQILSKFWAPVPCMLELAIILQFVLGEYLQAIVIGILLIFNAGLGLIKEKQTRNTIDALKSRLALEASVNRDGVWKTIPAAELVRGDIVKLSLGHVVGADVCILDGEVLLDHSMLTGESLPIEGGPNTKSYAGALVHRGQATAVVVATGQHTKYGRTAELVRIAKVGSSQEKAVLQVVRNLSYFNIAIVIIQLVCAVILELPIKDIIPLTLTALLAAIPVALPATFTLARVLGAKALVQKGVLPAQLSAVDEAATMDVLCLDKTGTLTQNELSVTTVHALAGFSTAQVLAFAALASSLGGQDHVDAAIHRAAEPYKNIERLPILTKLIPFDPQNKMSEAFAQDDNAQTIRIIKGEVKRVAELTRAGTSALEVAEQLASQGFRVLAVGIGPEHGMELAGYIGLSDPPRADSAEHLVTLKELGIHTLMITGDAPITAQVVAEAVGINGPVYISDTTLDEKHIESMAVYAGVSPEDKFNIVKAFQNNKHTVGMCGDGTNDAPALRQAQIGIAVANATDIAKSAAGIVLTQPGLAGIVAIVHEGRITFQRILTYTLRIVSLKLQQLMFLTFGLLMTGQAILSPMLMVLLMITGDFLAMSAASDNVRPSKKPNSWRIDTLTKAGFVIALCNLIFSSVLLAIGIFWLELDQARLMTLAAVILVFTRQILMYTVRERRRLWSSWPSRWLMLTSMMDVIFIVTFATFGILMTPLSPLIILSVFVLEISFAFILDEVKFHAFKRLGLV
ncbi:divalent cation transporter [Serratia sp. S1B]|nr:divalent cation transporter [Serratia sp. S1B]